MNRAGTGSAPRAIGPAIASRPHSGPTHTPRRPLQDPFLGSGTTLIAAQSCGRVCFAIELDPLYVDVAVKRWQAFTGEQATLLAGGRTFDAVAAGRLTTPDAVATRARKRG